MFNLLRKRPIYKFLPFQIIGIISSLAVNIPIEWLLSIIISLIGLSFTRFMQFTIPVLILSLSFSITQVSTHSYAIQDNELYKVRGKVESIKKSEFNNRVVVSTDSTKILFIDKEKNQMSVSDSILFTGILFSPKPIRNPGQFDYASYLTKQDISAICKEVNSIKIKPNSKFTINKIFINSRKYITNWIENSIPRPYTGFAKGLILGAKDELDVEVKERFKNIGVVHILAVSGLHVGFILLILFAICSLFRIYNGWRVVITTIGLVFYMGLTGWPASVIRAGTMAILYVYGQYREKKIDTWNIVGCTAFGFLLIDPHSLFDLGFQLSFSAVIGILYVVPQRQLLESKLKVVSKLCQYPIPRNILDLFLVTMGAQLGTFLPISFYFGHIPIFAWVANLMIVPLTGFALISALLSALINPISQYISSIYGEASWGIMWLMDSFGIFLNQAVHMNFNTRSLSSIYMILIYIILIFIFSFFRKRYWQHILILMLVFGNIWVYKKLITHDELIVTFLDVGQGDAIVIENNENIIIVDGGYKGFGKDYGKNVVQPYLNSKGIQNIELFVMSHPHADHIGGMSSVFENYKINQIWDTHNKYKSNMYVDYLLKTDSLAIPIIIPKPGNVYKLDELYLTVLYPDSSQSMNVNNINNASIVFRLDYFDTSVLFTGDIEFEAESIVSNLHNKLNVDFVKCGHHGSITSSSQKFIESSNADFCIVSVGENNKYNHPSVDIIERWESHGTKVYRTDLVGAITVTSNGFHHTIETMLK